MFCFLRKLTAGENSDTFIKTTGLLLVNLRFLRTIRSWSTLKYSREENFDADYNKYSSSEYSSFIGELCAEFFTYQYSRNADKEG